MVQRLGLHDSTAECSGSIPGRGTKIPQAMCSQKKKNIYIYIHTHTYRLKSKMHFCVLSEVVLSVLSVASLGSDLILATPVTMTHVQPTPCIYPTELFQAVCVQGTLQPAAGTRGGRSNWQQSTGRSSTHTQSRAWSKITLQGYWLLALIYRRRKSVSLQDQVNALLKSAREVRNEYLWSVCSPLPGMAGTTTSVNGEAGEFPAQEDEGQESCDYS